MRGSVGKFRKDSSACDWLKIYSWSRLAGKCGAGLLGADVPAGGGGPISLFGTTATTCPVGTRWKSRVSKTRKSRKIVMMEQDILHILENDVTAGAHGDP